MAWLDASSLAIVHSMGAHISMACTTLITSTRAYQTPVLLTCNAADSRCPPLAQSAHQGGGWPQATLRQRAGPAAGRRRACPPRASPASPHSDGTAAAERAGVRPHSTGSALSSSAAALSRDACERTRMHPSKQQWQHSTPHHILVHAVERADSGRSSSAGLQPHCAE